MRCDHSIEVDVRLSCVSNSDVMSLSMRYAEQIIYLPMHDEGRISYTV